ncbi:unnamed protein product, partial [Staurois parvus]
NVFLCVYVHYVVYSNLQAVEFTVVFLNAPNLRSGIDFISVSNTKHLQMRKRLDAFVFGKCF